jgi:hypothetical protein
VFPIWRLVQAPWWFSITDGRRRPAEEVAAYTRIFESEIARLDNNGWLTKSLNKQYDLLRKVAHATNMPWHMTMLREECLQQFRAQKLAAPIAEKGGRNGYATDSASFFRKSKAGSSSKPANSR